MTYFTSDLHFGHANIMKFHPNFRIIRGMDEYALLGAYYVRHLLYKLFNRRRNVRKSVSPYAFYRIFAAVIYPRVVTLRVILKNSFIKHIFVIASNV